MAPAGDWPEIEESDGPTLAALHLFSQIVGKVATAAVPWRNHGWHLTLHLTPRGLRTEPIHVAQGTFALAFDFIDHALVLEDAAGQSRRVALRPMAVAEFYRETAALLADAGYPIAIHGAPNEVEPATAFADDTQMRPYDRDGAARVWRALLKADAVFRLFRSGFLGKVSPVHFFWGSFDLAVTRFSGRPAPLHPGGIPHLPDPITQEAYSHEVSSAGFWPGGVSGGKPFFYSYAYPSPDGFGDARVRPDAARFDKNLGEYMLDYDAVRAAADPDALLMEFLESTYAAAADLAKWDRRALECAPGKPGVVRPL